MRRSVLILGMLVAAGTAAGLGRLQASDPPPDPERTAMRERLERRLNETNRIRDRLEAAIKQIDQGATLDDVRAGVFIPGEFRRPPGEKDRGDASRLEGRRSGPERADGGPPPEDRRGGPPGPREGGDPAADRRLVMGFLERYDPPMAERIKALLNDRPDDAGRWLGRLAPRIRELMAEKDDELRDLRIAEFRNGQSIMDAARRLGESMRDPAAPEQAEKTRAELREALGRQFDLRAKVHEREIAVLESRVRELRAELDEQTGKRDSYIDQRVEEIRRFTSEWAEHERIRVRPGKP
jgi:hypothetical protein